MQEYIEKAGVLIEALPYITRLSGKTVVIKYGGNAMVSEELKNKVMEDITLLKFVGVNPIVVHGGGPDINEALRIYNIESSFVEGLRVTDEKTVGIAQMVLVGKVNKDIVSILNTKGGSAIGLCGVDGRLIECRRKVIMKEGKEIDIGYVGDIVRINADALRMLASDRYIPVVAPIGVDESGQSYNINADTVASAIAAALNAEKLIMMTDIEGVKSSPDSPDIIYQMAKSQALEMIESGAISGGMIPKMRSCLEAIEAGIKRVHIIDGRIPHCILLEIFTDTGIGTMVVDD